MGPTRHGRPYPQISLSMTDCDVVEKAAGIMKAPSVRQVNVKQTQCHGLQAMYGFSINGMEAIEWMERLQPLMGQRRFDKINVILEINACW